jgi:hypothetical protein
MPLCAKIYIAIFILLIVSNLGYYFYLKLNLVLIAYDFFSGLFIALAMIAYWRPIVRDNITWIHALIFFLIIFFEFYLTVLGGYEKMGLKISKDIEEEDMDKIYSISLILTAPAYITGGTVMLTILGKCAGL